jgi:tetratricopeptide (TPR) repeat protein
MKQVRQRFRGFKHLLLAVGAFGILLNVFACRSLPEAPNETVQTPTQNPADSAQMTVDDLFNRGFEKRKKGDHQGAIADFSEVIRLQPDAADAYYNRGNARAALGDDRGSIADYDQAIKLNPNFSPAYNNRGHARELLGDNQGAIADYDQAIKLNQDWTENSGLHFAYNGRGNARSAVGDRQGAIADYNQAIKLKPDYASPHYNLGVIYQESGDKQNAIANLQKAAVFYGQQGNSEGYQNVLDRLDELL